jgi:hypothetical protein
VVLALQALPRCFPNSDSILHALSLYLLGTPQFTAIRISKPTKSIGYKVNTRMLNKPTGYRTLEYTLMLALL